MNFDFSDEQKQMRDEARKFLAEKCPPKAVRAVLDGKAPYDKRIVEGPRRDGLSRRRDPGRIRRRRRRPSRTLRDRRGNGPRAGAGAVLLRPSISRPKRCCWPAATRRSRNGCRRSRRARRSARWRCSKARAIRRRRRSSSRRPAARLNGVEEAGAGRRDCRFRRRRRAHRIERARFRYLAVPGRPEGRRRRGQGADQCRSDRAARPNSPSRIARPSRSVLPAKAGAFSPRCSTAPRCCWRSSRSAAPTARWKWAATTRSTVSPSAGRSARSRRSSTCSPTCMSRRRWRARIAITAPGRSRPTPSELPEAAAAARISATQAFQHCAKNNIQVHGGMGFTWEFDCHMYYRRANATALTLGSLSYWEDALIDRMRKRNAA